jgi:hypothetical protein
VIGLGDFDRFDELRDDVDALIRAEIVRNADARLSLTHASWISILREALAPDVEVELRGRFATVFHAAPATSSSWPGICLARADA